jgi:hypothetical protein
MEITKVTPSIIRLGKIEDAESTGGKFSKCKIGTDAFDPAKLTCVTKGKFKDNDNSLQLIFRDLFTLGLRPRYKWKKPPAVVEKIPENIVGYDLHVVLVDRERIKKPNEKEQAILNGLQSFTKVVTKFILKNRESLPLAFQNLKDEELAKCVIPIESPATDKFAASLFAKVQYFPAKPAEGKVPAKEARFLTVFRKPGGKADPSSLIGAIGNCTFVLKVNNLILITGDAKKDLKIKFECEVSEINFTPLTRQEANTLGEMAPAENADDSGETPKSSLEAFGINPSVTYGDTAPTTYGDESDSSQEEAPPAKKKKTVTPPPEEEDEVPAPKKSKKPVVEDEEPVSQPKKPKKPAVVEEETQPAPKKKSKKNVE